jgi:hypothetical protein
MMVIIRTAIIFIVVGQNWLVSGEKVRWYL